MRLLDDAAATHIHDLQRGLRALRLNRHFVPWQALRDHLDGLRPGLAEGVSLADGSAWPHPDAWLRVRVDHRLAPEMAARLAPLAASGAAGARQKLAYFTAMADVTPLPLPGVSVSLVEQREGACRYEIVVDRVELARPVFVRWTLRLAEAGAERLSPDAFASSASDHFERRLQLLSTQDAVSAMLLLRAEPGLDVEEVVRAEVGPALLSAGGPRLTAVLSRAATALTRTSIDDPLSGTMTVPNASAGFGLSHHRKWAVPRTEAAAFKSALRGKGCKNIVYGY